MRWLLALAVVAACFAGTVLSPHTMLSPGDMISGHQELADDCFACHAALEGTPSEKCTNCHPVTEIDADKDLTLHRVLARERCADCHRDHGGMTVGRGSLEFDHASLERSTRDRCSDCHRRPEDHLHRQLDGSCRDCHSDSRWAPADFEHDKYFRFDRRHPDRCSDCHPEGRLEQYTCYGCHAHSAQGIAREHREEGISAYEECVECHRSGNEEEAERRWKAMRKRSSGRRSRPDKGEPDESGSRRRHQHDDDD